MLYDAGCFYPGAGRDILKDISRALAQPFNSRGSGAGNFPHPGTAVAGLFGTFKVKAFIFSKGF